MPRNIPSSLKTKLVEDAKTLCQDHGAELLFLTFFGSTLYGTSFDGKSDLDLKGIFLPSLESLALGKAVKTLSLSTGNQERRNTADDVDMDLWSLQHWLLKLLPAGDTGAMDLLFSPSHEACILYKDPRLNEIFSNPLRLVDTVKGRAYAEYSLGQAKKYGIKGSRVGALKTVWKWLEENCENPAKGDRLGGKLDALIQACGETPFCSLEEIHGERALQLCGKMHLASIRLDEFMGRVASDMQHYGARAQDAERNQGLDFKALSHALRALFQMEELLQTGKILFPLARREELRMVKEGVFPWADIEPRILSHLESVDKLRNEAPYAGFHDAAFAENGLIRCYGKEFLRQGPSPEKKSHARFEKGFSIPEETLARILQKLKTAERKKGVKILYACESGSRGWGFASPDSDYDVRFIYVHPKEWYLGLAPEEKRDVLELGIEETPVGELDINGWELRKALKLFRQSNPPLLEWLSSPLIYMESGPLAELLRDTAPSSVSPIRTWHHYRSLMEKSRKRLEKNASIKVWFYVLRPLLAMRWIELGRGIPPMRFDLLMDGTIEDPDLYALLSQMVDDKKRAAEKDAFSPHPLVVEFVEKECARLEKDPPSIPAEREKADLDALFRKVLNAASSNEINGFYLEAREI
ncbi:nucleotidyltransferase domain-containing protein [Desulfococcaceae bacterium OttesenSCG-928-F15]|nr:nucleotidyltransferase domain-containing protein [Desulfococcaceae bacterium OttesenSCG-928-F15]